MKTLGKWLIENFGFSIAETRGFIIFFCFCLSVFFLSILIPGKEFISASNKDISHINIDDFITEEVQVIEIKDLGNSDRKLLNPNKLTFLDWTGLGLDSRTADNILRYRLAGGEFSNRSDLIKIYGINDSTLRVLKAEFLFDQPKNSIPDKSSYQKVKYSESLYEGMPTKEISPFSININDCDSFELLKIKGIGPVRSSRIIRYREKLGGYVDKSQYSEIFGMDSLSIKNLENGTFIEKDINFKKVNLNTDSFNIVLSHPYINYKLCKVLFSYRRQHGNFSGIKDLYKVKILDSTEVKKLSPYITF